MWFLEVSTMDVVQPTGLHLGPKSLIGLLIFYAVAIEHVCLVFIKNQHKKQQ